MPWLFHATRHSGTFDTTRRRRPKKTARHSRTDSFPDGFVDDHFLWASYPGYFRLQPCKNNPLFHTSASVRTFGPLPCETPGCRNNLQRYSAFFCIEEECGLPQNVGHGCQIGIVVQAWGPRDFRPNGHIVAQNLPKCYPLITTDFYKVVLCWPHTISSSKHLCDRYQFSHQWALQ